MRPISKAAPVLLALLFCLPPLFGATYVVDQRRSEASDDSPGSAEKPFKTIGRAAHAAQAGDTVLIRGGTYREWVKIDAKGDPAKPIIFAADSGAHVVVTGADVLKGWRKEENEVWSVEWPHRFPTHPGDDWHRMIGRCEQVVAAGYSLQQVLKREAVVRGTFYVDLDGKRLYACGRSGQNLSDNDARVEGSVRSSLWEVSGPYVHTKGLHFRYAANMAQHAMATFSGAQDVIEDCVFERANSSGAVFVGPDQVVRRCTFQENGQLGFGANRAHRLHLTECLIRGNNTKDFSRGWEAGGDKLVLSRGVVIDHCRIIENRGAGLWFDIGNEDCEVANCLIAENEESGIFYEISYGLHVHDCVIVGNGFLAGGGSWGAHAGLSLSSSPGGLIERNLFVGNCEGFNFREQDRTTPRIDEKRGAKEEPVWNHDQAITHNFFVGNADAQVWGWFDIGDERHWPKAMQEHQHETAKPEADMAADYKAKEAVRVPPGSSLETIKIGFAGNCYAPLPGQPLFHWGVAWKRNKLYSDLPALAAELGFESDGQVAEPAFIDTVARDFRLPKGHPALEMGAYPQGGVPGCVLGAK